MAKNDKEGDVREEEEKKVIIAIDSRNGTENFFIEARNNV